MATSLQALILNQRERQEVKEEPKILGEYELFKGIAEDIGEPELDRVKRFYDALWRVISKSVNAGREILIPLESPVCIESSQKYLLIKKNDSFTGVTRIMPPPASMSRTPIMPPPAAITRIMPPSVRLTMPLPPSATHIMPPPVVRTPIMPPPAIPRTRIMPPSATRIMPPPAFMPRTERTFLSRSLRICDYTRGK